MKNWVVMFVKRHPVICGAIGFVLLSWLCTACLPLIAMGISCLFTVSRDSAAYLKDYVFPELSAFGKMFGGLRVLFTGVGLVGVAYSLYRQGRKQRVTNCLSVEASLIDYYTSIYLSDPAKHNKDYDDLTLDGQTVDSKSDTIKGKLVFTGKT